MKKLLIVLAVVLLVMSFAVCFSQTLIDFDRAKNICYISESAWYSLPMTGPAGKIELLRKINLPPGWEVRGMYTNSLLAKIKSNGEIDFK